jgi:hypothetical protein
VSSNLIHAIMTLTAPQYYDIRKMNQFLIIKKKKLLQCQSLHFLYIFWWGMNMMYKMQLIFFGLLILILPLSTSSTGHCPVEFLLQHNNNTNLAFQCQKHSRPTQLVSDWQLICTILSELYINDHFCAVRAMIAWMRFELTTLVVIGTDSCKSNYHMITTTPRW